MIPFLFAVWAMAVPGGYLAGDLWADRHPDKAPDGLPWLTAIITPLGAVLAVILIFEANISKGDPE